MQEAKANPEGRGVSMNAKKKTSGIWLLGGLLALGPLGCQDLLQVEDPQRYTSEDLDRALTAVADGVEGDLHNPYSSYVNFTALASDEMQHSGTWPGWGDLDQGQWRYAISGYTNGVHNAFLRVRWFARDAQERFKNVLGEAEAMRSPLMAKVKAVEGWADLIMAESFCESPAEAGGPAVPYTEQIAIARTNLTEAMSIAQAAGATKYYNMALAGRARANLWLEDYGAARADAKAIPNGFRYDAEHSMASGRQANAMVTLATWGENRAATVREKWWPLVDLDAFLLRDPYTGELDPRVPILHYPGEKAVDGITDFYSQWKYQGRADNIAMTKKSEMLLIEAEVYWREGNLVQTMAILNGLRTAAGLTPHPTSPMPSADQVFEYFMHEMFAELFVEGRRFGYLHRLGQVAKIFGEMNDPMRPLPRPTMFPVSYTEALYNPNIEDDIAKRCLPMSGS